MQIAKKGLFWIVLNIILIPSVFALEWPTANDFLSVYENYYGWIDFFLAFMIFASIARLFVEKKFGTESTATKPLYVSLGLVLAIALVTWEVKSDFKLFQMGFVSLILLLVLLGVIIYNLIGDKLKGKDSKLDWAHLLFSLLIIILAILLFYPELLAYIPIADPDRLMGYAAAVCGLVALWFLVKWLLGRKKNGEKEPPPEKNEPPEKEKEGKDKTPEVKKATIIVKDEKNNVGTKFTQGAKLAIGITLEKSNVQIKDLKLEWILKDASTKLNCVFSGKGSGYFAGDKEIIEFDTSQANIGLISDKSKKTIDIILNIIDPNTNKVLMEKKEDIKILPSGTTPTEEPPEQAGTPNIILTDKDNQTSRNYKNPSELIPSNSYAIQSKLNKDAKSIKNLVLEWLITEVDSSTGKPTESPSVIKILPFKENSIFARYKHNGLMTYTEIINEIQKKGKTSGLFVLGCRLLEEKNPVKLGGNIVMDFIYLNLTESSPPAPGEENPVIILKDHNGNSPKKLSSAVEIVDSNSYHFIAELNKDAKNIKDLKVEWLVLEIDENENPNGGYIPISLMDYKKGLLTKKPELIYSDLLKTIRIKGYKNKANFFLYARLIDSTGNAIKNKAGNVFDYVAIKIPQLGATPPPPPSPSPKGKPREPNEIIPKEKGGEIMSQPPGIITITAEKQNPVAVQRDSTVTIETPRAYEIGYAMQKEPPKGTIISFMLADPQTHQMMQLGQGEYPLSIPIKRNTMPLNNYIVQIIFTYQNKSLLADWFNLKVVSALPAAYQVKGLLASGKQAEEAKKTRLNKEDIFAILESKIPEYAKEESTKKLRAGRKPYYPNFREYLEKIYKTGGRPLAVILREKGYEINDKEIEGFITPKLKEYFVTS